MNARELVFIPSPVVGHLVSTVEMAKLLINRDDRLFITILVMQFPFDIGARAYIESVHSTGDLPRLKFVDLPPIASVSDLLSNPPNTIFHAFIESQRINVRDAVLNMMQSGPNRPAAFVVDMFCVNMTDIAEELGVPTYLFFTSGAGFLGLMFTVQSLLDDRGVDVTEYKDSDAELLVPSYRNPVPAKVLPTGLLDKEGGSKIFMSCARKFRLAKGIIINTFSELEPHAIKSLMEDDRIPPVYHVGPVLNMTATGDDPILDWLEGQPPSSVVFLCFGSMGCFEKDQVKEIAVALEKSKSRFLWCLRRPPPPGKVEYPGEYSDPQEVLPEGFLERTSGIGKVIGWAPQVAVLSHPSVGGFVSHCGWNSILEALWFGVPIVTWPMYGEQQINAFEIVTELGIAVDLKMEYRNYLGSQNPVIVTAMEIERGIRHLMLDEKANEIRNRVKEMKQKSRSAVMENGSSCISLGCLLDDMMGNSQD